MNMLRCFKFVDGFSKSYPPNLQKIIRDLQYKNIKVSHTIFQPECLHPHDQARFQNEIRETIQYEFFLYGSIEQAFDKLPNMIVRPLYIAEHQYQPIRQTYSIGRYIEFSENILSSLIDLKEEFEYIGKFLHEQIYHNNLLQKMNNDGQHSQQNAIMLELFLVFDTIKGKVQLDFQKISKSSYFQSLKRVVSNISIVYADCNEKRIKQAEIDGLIFKGTPQRCLEQYSFQQSNLSQPPPILQHQQLQQPQFPAQFQQLQQPLQPQQPQLSQYMQQPQFPQYPQQLQYPQHPQHPQQPQPPKYPQQPHQTLQSNQSPAFNTSNIKPKELNESNFDKSSSSESQSAGALRDYLSEGSTHILQNKLSGEKKEFKQFDEEEYERESDFNGNQNNDDGGDQDEQLQDAQEKITKKQRLFNGDKYKVKKVLSFNEEEGDEFQVPKPPQNNSLQNKNQKQIKHGKQNTPTFNQSIASEENEENEDKELIQEILTRKGQDQNKKKQKKKQTKDQVSNKNQKYDVLDLIERIEHSGQKLFKNLENQQE